MIENSVQQIRLLLQDRSFSEAERVCRTLMPEAHENREQIVLYDYMSTICRETGRLDEAEECVKKAIELSKDVGKDKTKGKGEIGDIRMQITLARVQIARGDLAHARGTLRALRSRRSELSNYDRNRLEDLLRAAKMN